MNWGLDDWFLISERGVWIEICVEALVSRFYVDCRGKFSIGVKVHAEVLEIEGVSGHFFMCEVKYRWSIESLLEDVDMTFFVKNC